MTACIFATSGLSEVIWTNMNAFLAGTKTQDAALSDMQNRLSSILR